MKTSKLFAAVLTAATIIANAFGSYAEVGSSNMEETDYRYEYVEVSAKDSTTESESVKAIANSIVAPATYENATNESESEPAEENEETQEPATLRETQRFTGETAEAQTGSTNIFTTAAYKTTSKTTTTRVSDRKIDYDYVKHPIETTASAASVIVEARYSEPFEVHVGEVIEVGGLYVVMLTDAELSISDLNGITTMRAENYCDDAVAEWLIMDSIQYESRKAQCGSGEKYHADHEPEDNDIWAIQIVTPIDENGYEQYEPLMFLEQKRTVCAENELVVINDEFGYYANSYDNMTIFANKRDAFVVSENWTAFCLCDWTGNGFERYNYRFDRAHDFDIIFSKTDYEGFNLLSDNIVYTKDIIPGVFISGEDAKLGVADFAKLFEEEMKFDESDWNLPPGNDPFVNLLDECKDTTLHGTTFETEIRDYRVMDGTDWSARLVMDAADFEGVAEEKTCERTACVSIAGGDTNARVRYIAENVRWQITLEIIGNNLRLQVYDKFSSESYTGDHCLTGSPSFCAAIFGYQDDEDYSKNWLVTYDARIQTMGVECRGTLNRIYRNLYQETWESITRN